MNLPKTVIRSVLKNYARLSSAVEVPYTSFHEILRIKYHRKIAAIPLQFLHSCSNTTTPALIDLATASASQLVRRMQPCDCVLPMLAGSGVPWMP